MTPEQMIKKKVIKAVLIIAAINIPESAQCHNFLC